MSRLDNAAQNAPLRILAIDSSTEACSVSLQLSSGRYSRSSSVARAHAQALLPMIDALLEQACMSLSELDGLAIVNGPGSFTGLRIAMSVLQGLAYGADLPVYAASSLEAMAATYVSQTCPTEGKVHLVPALDARMNEVYWAVFHVDDTGEISECMAPRVTARDDFINAVSDLAENAVTYALGDVFDADDIAITSLHGVDSGCAPSAEALLDALTKFSKQKQSIRQLEPLYLRNEVAWQKRTRIRQHAIT